MPLYVICPFFQYEHTKPPQFKCELQMMNFDTYAHMSEFMKSHCCTWNYDECENAKILLKGYDENDNN